MEEIKEKKIKCILCSPLIISGIIKNLFSVAFRGLKAKKMVADLKNLANRVMLSLYSNFVLCLR